MPFRSTSHWVRCSTVHRQRDSVVFSVPFYKKSLGSREEQETKAEPPPARSAGLDLKYCPVQHCCSFSGDSLLPVSPGRLSEPRFGVSMLELPTCEWDDSNSSTQHDKHHQPPRGAPTPWHRVPRVQQMTRPLALASLPERSNLELRKRPCCLVVTKGTESLQ